MEFTQIDRQQQGHQIRRTFPDPDLHQMLRPLQVQSPQCSTDLQGAVATLEPLDHTHKLDQPPREIKPPLEEMLADGTQLARYLTKANGWEIMPVSVFGTVLLAQGSAVL